MLSHRHLYRLRLVSSTTLTTPEFHYTSFPNVNTVVPPFLSLHLQRYSQLPRNIIIMRLSDLLITSIQLAVALSAPSADERRTVNAADHAHGQLTKRNCWYGAPYGCSKGYCWKSCSQVGDWCWLASNDGNGGWLGCSNDNHCAPASTQGSACGKGNCHDCGCSCFL